MGIEARIVTAGLVSARNAIVLMATLMLGGCASFSSDGGLDAVASATAERGLKPRPQWVRSEDDGKRVRASVANLLQVPVGVDAAVEIALLNNPGLQAAYADLGIAEADLVQAGRLGNPGFSFARLRRGDELEIERTFLFDVLGLITMPIRTELERRRFELT
ncbi:MAG: TolC family protein, partial [Burkholderiales bacterium]